MRLFSFIFLTLALILEVSLTSVPLLITVFIPLAVLFRKNELFVWAFFYGFLFDILTFKTIGLSSAALVTIVFLIFSYQSKFEINSVYFVALSSFLGSLGFLFITGGSSPVFGSFAGVIISLGIFELLSKLNK